MFPTLRVLSGAAVLAALLGWSAAAQVSRDDTLRDAQGATRRGDFAHADAGYQSLIQADPKDAEALDHLALVRAYMTHYEAALATVDRAVALAPTDLDIVLTRARILAFMRRYDEASSEVARVLAARPQDGDALTLQGRIALYRGMPERARGSFEAALRADPTSFDAVLGLGDAARASGRESEAMTYFSRARAMDPSSPEIADRLRPHPQDDMPKWQVTGIVDHSWLSRVPLQDWSEQTFRMDRITGRGSGFFGSVLHAHRFGVEDVEIDAGASTAIGSGTYAQIEGGGTPNAKFLPEWRLAAGLQTRLFETTYALFDASLRRYGVGTVKGVNAGLEQYAFDGRLDLTAKMVNSFDPTGKSSTGFSLAAVITPIDPLHLRAGYANAPEVDTGIVATTRSLSAGVCYDLTQRLTLRVDYLHEDREHSYLRKELTAGISLKF